MGKKNVLAVTAVLCMATALIMFAVISKENAVHDYFWIPLVTGAIFLFAATRIK